MPAITFNADADFTYTVMSETQTGTVNLKGDFDACRVKLFLTSTLCPKCLYASNRRRLFRRRQTA